MYKIFYVLDPSVLQESAQQNMTGQLQLAQQEISLTYSGKVLVAKIHYNNNHKITKKYKNKKYKNNHKLQ